MLRSTRHLVVALVMLAGVAAVAADERPNILFIYTDDQSHRTVSCYPEAYDWVRTPNIDRLAANGIRFEHAYIGTWCMPSRATMLTGLHQHGVQSMRMEGQYPGSAYDANQCPFWPKVFRDQGYVTAQIGKWHTGTDTGAGRDWDYQVVWNRPAHPENAFHYFYDQLISIDGGKPKLVKGYSTDNYTKWALEFIRGQHRDPDKPWYLWLCYAGVHAPFTPAERHLDEYPDIEAAAPPDIYPPRPGKPAYMQRMARWVKNGDGQPVLRQADPHKTLTDWVRQYHQGVLALDEGVKQLVEVLEETGQRKKTLIVFTSDQGYAWGQHGFRMKMAPYDATLRAPLIVSMPGTLPTGKVCSAPVGGADLVPTFFQFAGLDLPWEMHGHDLTPLLRDPQADWKHSLLMTFTGAVFGRDSNEIKRDPLSLRFGVPWWVFLRQGRYKYIRTLVENEVEELYDLDADPEELTNLAARHPAKVTELREATLAELRRTGAGMVEHLPSVMAQKQ